MHEDQLPTGPAGDEGHGQLPARTTAGRQLQPAVASRALALDLMEDRRGDEDEIDLLAYWRILAKRRWLILGIAGVAIALALVMTLMATPMYRATVVLKMESGEQQVLPLGQGMISGFNWDPEFIATQSEVLKSRSLAERVAEDLKLDDDALARLRPQSWTQRLVALFGPEPAEAAVDGLADVADAPAADASEAALRAATGVIHGGVAVEPVIDTRLVRVHFTSTLPEFAARAANAIADGFIASELDRRIGASDYAKDYLEQQLQLVKSRLEQSERELVAFAQKENLVSTGEGEPSLVGQNLADLNTSLAAAQSLRIRAQAAWNQVRGGGALPATAIAGSILNTLQQQRAGLQAQYQQQLKVYKEDYPSMVALKGQIDEVDRQIAQERAGVRAAIRAEYEAAVLNETLLKNQLAELRNQTLDVDDRSIEYNILRREADTNRQLYDGLLQRYKEIGVAGDLRPNNISIVDRAQVPGGRFSPSVPKNVAVGLLLGLLLGVLLAFVLEFLDDTIKTPDDLEQHLRLAVLGVVPHLKRGSLQEALADPRSAFSESYRSVRTALQFSTDSGVPRVLLVTSPSAAEGKSTSALTLARNFAQLGKRVLLIEADLRNPSLHRALGVRSETGLSSLLAGAASANQVILDTDDERLKVILAGPLPPNPAELLSGSRLLSALTVAAERYDQVIVDGPPVLGIADAPILASLVSGTLLVVQSGQTRIKVAQAALKRLAAARAHIIGGLLTHYDAKASGYGYGYDYASHYSYGAAPRLGKG